MIISVHHHRYHRLMVIIKMLILVAKGKQIYACTQYNVELVYQSTTIWHWALINASCIYTLQTLYYNYSQGNVQYLCLKPLSIYAKIPATLSCVLIAWMCVTSAFAQPSDAGEKANMLIAQAAASHPCSHLFCIIENNANPLIIIIIIIISYVT